MKSAIVLVAVYGAACLGLYSIMLQPPKRFGAIMAHVPRPLTMVLPFPILWNAARSGSLDRGAMAPDFELARVDGGETVRLSDFRGERPVVLIFGSYT